MIAIKVAMWISWQMTQLLHKGGTTVTKERFPRAQEDGHRAHQVSGCRGGNQGTRSPAVFRNTARLLLLKYQDEGRAKKQE